LLAAKPISSETSKAERRSSGDHGSIWDSWPIALSGCPRGPRVGCETMCPRHTAPNLSAETRSRTRVSLPCLPSFDTCIGSSRKRKQFVPPDSVNPEKSVFRKLAGKTYRENPSQPPTCLLMECGDFILARKASQFGPFTSKNSSRC
jgi:hypothetical protein